MRLNNADAAACRVTPSLLKLALRRDRAQRSAKDPLLRSRGLSTSIKVSTSVADNPDMLVNTSWRSMTVATSP